MVAELREAGQMAAVAGGGAAVGWVGTALLAAAVWMDQAMATAVETAEVAASRAVAEGTAARSAKALREATTVAKRRQRLKNCWS